MVEPGGDHVQLDAIVRPYRGQRGGTQGSPAFCDHTAVRVLLTGATGYIGAVVAETLAARGHTVVGTARSPAAEAELAARGT